MSVSSGLTLMGLFLDLVGFTFLAIDLFLPIFLQRKEQLARDFDEELSRDVSGLIQRINENFEHSSNSSGRPVLVSHVDLKPTLVQFQREAVEPKLAELTRSFPMRFSRIRKIDDLVGEASSQFADRYDLEFEVALYLTNGVYWRAEPAFSQLRRIHTRFRGTAGGAIAAILLGFVFQIAGAFIAAISA